jgi:hypothetical protein
MGVPERFANATAGSGGEGTKMSAHDWYAVAIYVKYGIYTAAEGRAKIADVYPDLTGAEKSAIVTWLGKVNTVTLAAGELEPDLMWAACILLEDGHIGRGTTNTEDWKAVHDR